MKLIETLSKRFSEKLSGYRYVIVQHMLPDVVEFVTCMRAAGAEVFTLISKPAYSQCEQSMREMQAMGFPIKFLTGIPEQDKALCACVLEQAEAASSQDGKKIIILDLAGEYADITYEKEYAHLHAVIEDTAFGHRKYENREYQCLIYSVAQSHCKELEARFVGGTIASAAELLIRNLGQTLYGKNIMVIGYGMIGRNTALTLRSYGAKVTVAEKDSVRAVNAFFDGFEIGSISTHAKQCQIIIGATGYNTITLDCLKDLRDGTWLFSGSSKQIEISVEAFKKAARSITNPFTGVMELDMDGKKLYIANNGNPINYLGGNSIPNEVIDFMFAEMIYAILQSEEPTEKEKRGIHTVGQTYVEEIAELYLTNTQIGYKKIQK